MDSKKGDAAASSVSSGARRPRPDIMEELRSTDQVQSVVNDPQAAAANMIQDKRMKGIRIKKKPVPVPAFAPNPNQEHPVQSRENMHQEREKAIVDLFYAQQTEEKLKEDAKKQEEREKEAAKNKMSKAQLDVKEDRCDECNKANCMVLKLHEGTKVCTACGVVSQLSMIDQTNEKRIFSSDMGGADQNQSRVNQGGDSFMPRNDGVRIAPGFANQPRWHTRPSYDNHQRNLQEGERKIRELAETLNLKHTDLLTHACEYFKKIEQEKVLKGKSLDVKVACVFFAAARQTKKNRNMSLILNYVDTDWHEVNKAYKKCSELFQFVSIRPSQIVEMTCQKMNLPHDVERAAKITADNFRQHALCEGKRPTTIAGVSLFMILKLKKFKKDPYELLDRIAKEVDITTETIRDTYTKVKDQRHRLLPDYLLNKPDSGAGGGPRPPTM